MTNFALLFKISLVSVLAANVAIAGPILAPAFYVFGDSLVDAGNNNYLPVGQKANFPHYGVDFPGGIPTGRFSNGLNGADFIAQSLGFPIGPPAYLSIIDTNQMLQGVNFASGGSGILDDTGPGTLTMNTQIKYFQNVTNALEEKLGKNRAEAAIAKSIFLFSPANNDIFAHFLMTGGKDKTANKKFVDNLVDKFIEKLKAVHMLNARKFLIFGTGHLGCIPLMRSLGPTGACTDLLNELSKSYNLVAKKRLKELSYELPGMKYSYANIAKMSSAAEYSPSAFGFTDIENACCGGGRNGAETGCAPNATFCSNRSTHLFWDQFHPTEANSRMTVTLMFKDPLHTFISPINLYELATRS